MTGRADLRDARCDWREATAAQQARFPEMAAGHAGHGPGTDLTTCDAWVCPCGNTAHGAGFDEIQWVLICGRCHRTFTRGGRNLTP